MAQVWVTHEVLATLCGCSVAAGRAHAKRWRWAESVLSKGVSYVRLPDDLAFDFMARSTLDRQIDQIADGNVSEKMRIA